MADEGCCKLAVHIRLVKTTATLYIVDAPLKLHLCPQAAHGLNSSYLSWARSVGFSEISRYTNICRIQVHNALIKVKTSQRVEINVRPTID